MSVNVQIQHWHCPKCDMSLNRQFVRRPIRTADVTCRQCGEVSRATAEGVIASWRISCQMYGVLVIWALVVPLSLVLPVDDRSAAVIMAAVFGWMPGLFPGFLITTLIGNNIGRRYARSLGLEKP